MNRVFNVFALVFAAGLLSIGLLLGYGNTSDACGAPFDAADGIGEACEVALADQRQLPLAMIGVGVTLGFAVFFAYAFAPIVPRDDAVDTVSARRP